MSFVYWTRSCLWSSDNACGTNREATFLFHISSTNHSSATILTVTHVLLVFVFSLS